MKNQLLTVNPVNPSAERKKRREEEKKRSRERREEKQRKRIREERIENSLVCYVDLHISLHFLNHMLAS